MDQHAPSPDIDDLFTSRIRDHPAWRGWYPGADHRGFSEPDIRNCTLYHTSQDDTLDLKEHGIRINGQPGRGSMIILDREFKSPGLQINFHGHPNTTIVLGPSTKFRGHINIEGHSHSVVFAGTSYSFAINATMRGHSGALFVGRGGSANNVDFLVEGPGVSVAVGNDSLISYDVGVATSDSHGIISLKGDTAFLNPPSSIYVGAHVWLGAHCTIHKGRTIGCGSIVGGRSVVTRDVPPCTLVAGVPAEIKQVDVTWTRETQPSLSSANEMRARMQDAEVQW